jgi:hypothetical protein
MYVCMYICVCYMLLYKVETEINTAMCG